MSFNQDELTQDSPQQKSTLGKGLRYDVDVTIKKYLSYIVVISFTGGGNRSDQTKPDKILNTTRSILTFVDDEPLW
jgi:hypothetical protein